MKLINHATHLFKSYKSYAHFFANRICTGDYEHGGLIYENFVSALIARLWYDEEQARRHERGRKPKGEAVAGQRHPMHAHARLQRRIAPSRTSMNALNTSLAVVTTARFMASVKKPWTSRSWM